MLGISTASLCNFVCLTRVCQQDCKSPYRILGWNWKLIRLSSQWFYLTVFSMLFRRVDAFLIGTTAVSATIPSLTLIFLGNQVQVVWATYNIRSEFFALETDEIWGHTSNIRLFVMLSLLPSSFLF